MADREPAGATKRAATAAGTLLVVAAIFSVTWISARPSVGEVAGATGGRTEVAVDVSTTTTVAPVLDDTGDPGEDLGVDRMPDRFRLVYDVETNGGSRFERVYARDGRRWSLRDEESWFVHDGEVTVYCAIGANCQRKVGPNSAPFSYGVWDMSLPGLADAEPRRIAGMSGRCETYQPVGGTMCVADQRGLLLLSDPGPDAMRPSVFRSERSELKSLGEPRETDFAPPSA